MDNGLAWIKLSKNTNFKKFFDRYRLTTHELNVVFINLLLDLSNKYLFGNMVV